MSRLDDLRELRDGLTSRMEACESDQNFAVMGRLLVDVVKQIDELDPAIEKRETGLDEFSRRLRERESAAKAARRPQAR